MRSIRKLAVLGIVAAAGALAAPAAHAFTMENNDAAGAYGVPKFDIEEQAKNFSKGGADTSLGKNDGSVPFAGGTLNFGVRQGSNFNSGFGPGFLGPMNRDTRQDFNHIVTPESLK
jgi:hypothetical protein